MCICMYMYVFIYDISEIKPRSRISYADGIPLVQGENQRRGVDDLPLWDDH